MQQIFYHFIVQRLIMKSLKRLAMFKYLLETLGSHHAAVGMLALLLVSRMSMIIHLLSMKTYLVSYSIILTSHCTCVINVKLLCV